MAAVSHIPVLRDEAVAMLRPRDGGVYLDGTFGGGGYARAILEAARCTLFAFDRDPAAILRGADFVQAYGGRLTIVQARISEILARLEAAGIARLDGAVFDFGVSSFQIDDPARGFSFRADGPLDMRMGDAGPSAADLVNRLGEAELADIFYAFGEEKASRRIAAAIVARRGMQIFERTADLAAVIRSVVRVDRKNPIDPATRTFQALRIAVNEELDDVAAGLAQAAALLAPGGRLVAVTFHSLEDRIVKEYFAKIAGRAPGVSRHDPSGFASRPAADFAMLTRKPVEPGEAELRGNPRARSAKLRAVERVAA